MRHQAAVVRTRHDGHGADAGLPGQQRLDLADLDAVSPQLHLIVDPAEDLDADAGHEAPEVAGPVAARGVAEARQPFAQLRQIAEAHAGPADHHLPGAPGRQRGARRVDHRQDVRPQAAAHRDRRAAFVDRVVQRDARGAHRRLGRAVVVVHTQRRRDLPQPLVQRTRQQLPAEHECFAREQRERIGRLGQQRRQVRGDQLHRGRGIRPEPLGESGGARGGLGGDELDASAARQGREDRRVGEVRGEAGDRRELGALGQAERFADGRRVVRHLLVPDDHALRYAGGARGEDHVGRARRLGAARHRTPGVDDRVGRGNTGDGGPVVGRRVGCEQQYGVGFPQDRLDPLPRPRGVDGDERRAREPDSEHRDDRLRRGRGEQRDPLPGPHAVLTQQVCHRVRAQRRVPVGHDGLAAAQRGSRGRAVRLREEAVEHRGMPRGRLGTPVRRVRRGEPQAADGALRAAGQHIGQLMSEGLRDEVQIGLGDAAGGTDEGQAQTPRPADAVEVQRTMGFVH